MNYKVEHRGYAWWPGEVRQFRELLPFANGEKGKLMRKLPLNWAAMRDPEREGLKNGLLSKPVDLAFWNDNREKYSLDRLKDYPIGQWEMLSTDLYSQAQGVLHPDHQSFTGDLWYRTEIDLAPKQAAGSLHLRFPGLFNECWLYVGGKEVAYRKQGKMWWLNDYRFEWDVDLTGKLSPGLKRINTIFSYILIHDSQKVCRGKFITGIHRKSVIFVCVKNTFFFHTNGLMFGVN